MLKNPAKSRFAFDRFSHRVTAVPTGGDLVTLTSWSQLDGVTRDVEGFDGTVLVALDEDDLLAGRSTPSYLDESVVCGGLPRDLPWLLEDHFGELVTALSDLLRAPRWVRGAFASALALRWRADGYPAAGRELDLDVMLGLAAEVAPALTLVERTASGGYWLARPVPRGLEVLTARADDAPEVVALLRAHGRTATLADALELVNRGALLMRDLHDRLVALSAPASAGSPALRLHSRRDNDKVLSLVDELVAGRATGDHPDADGYCHTCSRAAVRCSCPRDPAAFTAALLSALSATGSHAEHRWGTAHASRPSGRDVVRASRTSAAVRDVLASSFPDQVDAWEAELTRAVWFDVALFLAQCHQEPAVLSGGELAPRLVGELLAARARVASIHDYAKTLYEDFEAPSARLTGLYTEVYLGRDAVFAYHARCAQLRALAALTRSSGAGRDDVVRPAPVYAVVSRTAEWVSGVHTPLLGRHPVVFVDTGYSGSIPRAIAASEHLSIMDKAGPRAAPVEMHGPVAQVRLMSTTNAGYRFSRQWSHGAVGQIESDAKPTHTATGVNEARPTSALEQLVFRVLRREIADLAERRTREVVSKGVHRILTYQDAMRFAATERAKREAAAAGAASAAQPTG